MIESCVSSTEFEERYDNDIEPQYHDVELMVVLRLFDGRYIYLPTVLQWPHDMDLLEIVEKKVTGISFHFPRNLFIGIDALFNSFQ